MELRWYQQEAVKAIYQHLRERDDNPVAVLPTASGKTPLLATIARDAVERWNGRVLILAHVKELLEQAVDKLHQVAPDLWLKVGVYSAGMKSRDTQQPIIVAGIQSAYRRARELGRFDIAIIDEAHCIPPDGDGMYQTLLAGLRETNPLLRVIGLTATPFRMSTGSICAPENILNHVCYEVGVRELIVQGFLCPLVSKASREQLDTSGLHVRAGEFVADEVEDLMDGGNRVESACHEILDQTRERHSVLIFAAGVRHARHIADVLRGLAGVDVGTIFGDTPDAEREKILADFKASTLKYLVNVNVLTTGFDAPTIDCVAILRPTMSPGLLYQMIGRGFRLHEGKANCLVLDFGGNVLRHGPVDAIRVREPREGEPGEAPAKACPVCHSIIAAGYATCPDCGHMFPPPQKSRHAATAATEGILTGQVSTVEYDVLDVTFSVHLKRGAPVDAPRTLRVEYKIGFNHYQSEWICFEHTGFARQRAEAWWRRRSDAPIPATADTAVALAEAGALADTRVITVRHVAGEDFPSIVGHELEPKPPWREPGWDEDEPAADNTPTEYAWADDQDLPF